MENLSNNLIEFLKDLNSTTHKRLMLGVVNKFSKKSIMEAKILAGLKLVYISGNGKQGFTAGLTELGEKFIKDNNL